MPGEASNAPTATYWDAIGRGWLQQPLTLWREFTDRQQLELIRSWLPLPAPPAGIRSLLKTDLFDEVAHRGLVAELLRVGLAVSAVDLSPLIAAEAVARNPGLVGLPADVRQLPFAPGHFDAVFSGSTLDHLDSAASIAAALGEINRVLRPGGRLILTMDNPENPLIRLRNGALLARLQRLGVVPYQVGATLARRPLLAAVRAAGFEVVATRAVMHCPRVLAVWLSRPMHALPPPLQAAYLRLIGWCEWLERLPSRWWTGHYIAVLARKR